ncbi:hypothetical protein AXG93_3559s1020 [Marchantia polymorpha subsp. ruderalis]|uniref:Uncharacterized protein n=1 Tax=Marchantia polymorpha subsp. ruderalis TaxID=1480154 RepID=A0A176WNL5_MARPO|nr:hypothetical protein AXG93_3559s1020 [Marchantia polymorpha subsp. ruderalis]
MEAVAVGSSVGSLSAQFSKVSSSPKPVHANLSTNLRGSPVVDISRRNRSLCRPLPVESQNDVNLSLKAGARCAMKFLEEDVKEQQTTTKPKPDSKVRPPLPPREVPKHGGIEGAVGLLTKAIANGIFSILQYKLLEDENIYTKGNFAPVEEIGDKLPVQILSGAIPQNFPSGTYIRTGPNPMFHGKYAKSIVGSTKFHWFEGDGMLHATYIEKRGDEYHLSYKNKFVEAAGYLVDKEAGKPLVLQTMEGSPWGLLINGLLNQARFGFQSKPTCNTSIYVHGGRVFAASENNLPYEINVSDLSTVGVFDFKGAWSMDNFTAHPKIDPKTKELIGQGFSVTEKPHNAVGVISADGETLIHEIGLDSGRTCLNHDLAITERYIVILDFPICIDPLQILEGKSKIGVLPRYGDSNSVRWFTVETCSMFHIINAFDDGNEVVIHGLRSKMSFLNTDMNLDKAKWYSRGLTRSPPGQEELDPLSDGALLTYPYEWRIDLESGNVTERVLVDEEISMEMPRINESYVGRKHRYGYVICHDLDQSRKEGVPYFGEMSKIDFSSCENGKGRLSIESHHFGPNRYGGEPVFVPKPGSTEEDDGWIITYVHDMNTGQSEAIIVDAKKFSEEPVARLLLPCRVPFGFHGAYVYDQ